MSGLSPSATCYNIFLRALSARPSFVGEKWRQTSQTRDNQVVTNQCQLNQSSTQLRQRVSRSDTRYTFVQIFILFCHSTCNDDDTSPQCRGRDQHRAGRLAWNQRTHRCCMLLPQAHALARAVRRQDLHRAGAQLDSQHHRQVKTQKSSKPGLQKKIF